MHPRQPIILHYHNTETALNSFSFPPLYKHPVTCLSSASPCLAQPHAHILEHSACHAAARGCNAHAKRGPSWRLFEFASSLITRAREGNNGLSVVGWLLGGRGPAALANLSSAEIMNHRHGNPASDRAEIALAPFILSSIAESFDDASCMCVYLSRITYLWQWRVHDVNDHTHSVFCRYIIFFIILFWIQYFLSPAGNIKSFFDSCKKRDYYQHYNRSN